MNAAKVGRFADRCRPVLLCRCLRLLRSPCAGEAQRSFRMTDEDKARERTIKRVRGDATQCMHELRHTTVIQPYWTK